MPARPRCVLTARWTFAGLLLLAGAARAQPAAPTPDTRLGHYFFDSKGAELGLVQSDILVAHQTKDGYLWIGTSGGLARFDGMRFVPFRMSNTPAFLSPHIHCLLEDRDGSLWIGTERGVVRHRHGVFELIGLPQHSIRCLAEDGEGRIWLGTDRGLQSYHEGQWHDHGNDPAMAHPPVGALHIDASGRLWVGFPRSRGVVYFDGNAFHRLPASIGMTGEVQAIAEHPRGTLWFATRRNGLMRLRNDQLTRYTRAEGVSDNHVTDVKTTPSGKLWVVARTIQQVVDPERFVVEDLPLELTESARSVCEDREGGLWICARTGGLFRARRLPYRHVTADDGLPSDGVRSVTQDNAGVSWIVLNNGGVACLDPRGAVTRYGPEQGLPELRADVIYAARDGRIWIAYPRNVYVLKDGVVDRVFEVRSVQSLFESKDGTMWLGTNFLGVYRYADGQMQKAPIAFPRPEPDAASFAEGPDGALYVGTWRHGIYKFHEGRTTRFSLQNGLPADEVRSVYVDESARLWAGLRGKGLAVLDEGRWLNPSALAEAVADQVNGITADRHGRLWLGTGGGVMWATAEDLLAVARGAVRPSVLHVAELGDGRRSPSVWAGGQPTVWRSATGELAFATRQGALIIDPAHPPVNKVPPPVRVEEVAVDRRPVSMPHDGFVVPAGTRDLTISYTALSFIQPHRILFKYKMDGYDSDWVDAATRRTAYYTNLAPGGYVFRVMACNSDGVWNESPAVFTLSVAPFVWQTWWFRLLAVAVFTTGVVAIVRYVSFRRLHERLRVLSQQAALEKERTRIARDIHDDIGNRLTEITLLSSLALRDRSTPDKVGGYVQQISTGVRQVTDSLDEIVWAVNPRNDTLPHLINYMGQFSVQFLHTAGLQCQLTLPENPPDQPVPSDMRHNLFLIVKEALSNIVRHARASEVSLSIAVTARGLEVMIADNGRGFSNAPDDPNADGLRNMRQRTQEVGGNFQIDSKPGAGTRIALNFPAVRIS